MSRRGKLFVLSGPSGSGKTTLSAMLTDALHPELVRSVTCTTRAKRKGEKDGVDYHFLSREEFISRQKRGDFLETATVFGNEYGTLKTDVERLQDEGRSVILVIDVQGAIQVKEKADAVLLFLFPPSEEKLEERLRGRKTDSEEVIEGRLAKAKEELAMAGEYDFSVVNCNLKEAFEELKTIVLRQMNE
ncbi:MAG: guanylate kinase [Simkaniaceae bacterium]|nr:guanylate kinase [Simkaniaceae bacterium]